MKKGKSYLYKELIQLKLETFFKAVTVFFLPSRKERCVLWFMRKSDYVLAFAENGLLNSEDRKLLASISVIAGRIDKCCSFWCDHIVYCSIYHESAWKNV